MSQIKKRPARLGRGLSSLMAQPVKVQPLDEVEAPSANTPAAAPTAAATTAADEAASAAGTPVETPSPEVPAVTGKGAPASEAAAPEQAPADAQPGDADGLRHIPVHLIEPNPRQPRQQFDQPALERLADSIKTQGLMQPIIVRPRQGGDPEQPYELVAGERRWRAAQLAGLEAVPAIVRELDDQQLAEWALIENLQREDLNPMERAQAFQRLIDAFGLSHEDIAARVGLERSTISNSLRLLTLSYVVQRYVRDGRLSMGHARALAGLTDHARQQAIAEQTLRQGLSVRQVEQLVRRAASADAAATSDPSPGRVRSTYLADLEQQIAHQLATKVKIRAGRKKGSGTLAIEFYSLDQFDTLLSKLGVQAE